MQIDDKKLNRFSKSKKYLIIYIDIDYQEVWNYFRQLLNPEEILDISKSEEDNMVKVSINLNNPLQLHKSHRLVVIGENHFPTFMKNFPRKTYKELW